MFRMRCGKEADFDGFCTIRSSCVKQPTQCEEFRALSYNLPGLFCTSSTRATRGEYLHSQQLNMEAHEKWPQFPISSYPTETGSRLSCVYKIGSEIEWFHTIVRLSCTIPEVQHRVGATSQFCWHTTLILSSTPTS